MPQPLVSIITPTFNHGAYILDCIQSVQNQTYPNWEMLIVNDGSTDTTAELVAKAIKNDARIQLFNQTNIGIFRLAESYNFALSKAKGSLIAILEGDDIWMNDKLEKQVKAFADFPETIVCWGRDYTVHGEEKEIDALHPAVIHNDAYANRPLGSLLNLLYFENCIPALTLLIKKQALDEIGGFQQGFNLPLVDLPTLLALSLKGPFYFDISPLGSWRIYANQVTKTFPMDIVKGRHAAALSHLQNLPLEIKSGLNAKEKTINAYFKDRIMRGYAMSGRYKLIRKDFKGARKDYFQALFFKGVWHPIWRLRALVGIVCSYLKTDVEGIAGLIGKKTYARS